MFGEEATRLMIKDLESEAALMLSTNNCPLLPMGALADVDICSDEMRARELVLFFRPMRSQGFLFFGVFGAL